MVLVALLVLLAAEVATLIWVAGQIGVAEAILLLVVVSALGPWLVRRAGVGTWRRARERLGVGEVPGREATDGLLLFGAGALICVPGFITDAVGLLLLLPPVRAGVRRLLVVRLGRWAAVGRPPTSVVGRTRARRRSVVDAGSRPAATGDPDGPPPPPQLGEPGDRGSAG